MDDLVNNENEKHLLEDKKEDESCILIENNVSIIDLSSETLKEEKIINNDIQECSDQEVIENELTDLPSGYLVVDQTFGSSCEQSPAKNHNDKNLSEANGIEDIIQSTPIQHANKSDDNQRTLIDIKFRSKKTYLALHEDFIDIIKKYYKNKLEDLDIHDDPANNKVSLTERRIKKSDVFLIDLTPCLKNADESAGSESTPRYTSLSKKVLTFEKPVKEKEENGQKSMNMSANKCFNCDRDNHSLRECPDPKNMSKIRRARNDFNRKELRYHDDDDEYSSFIPGKIGEELKEALGLTSNQVPLHVYRMRLFGYPPGWLEEAKIHNSGLSLFVEKDKAQQYNEDDYKYDLQKIYDYPGFNILPEPPFVDKHRLYNVPPMLQHHTKDALIRCLGEQVVSGYKKRKINDGVGNFDITSNTEADMDVENTLNDDDQVMPLGVTIYKEPPPPGDFEHEKPPEPSPEPEEEEEGEIAGSDSELPASPSFAQLKRERDILLSELANVSSTSSMMNTSTLTIHDSRNTLHVLDETIIENSVNENIDNCSKDIIQHGHVETTVFGAPVLPSFSPFENLPEGDKFQEGVCDVIAFENLAESTGKYEKMKGVIKKVRCVLKEHHKE